MLRDWIAQDALWIIERIGSLPLGRPPQRCIQGDRLEVASFVPYAAGIDDPMLDRFRIDSL